MSPPPAKTILFPAAAAERAALPLLSKAVVHVLVVTSYISTVGEENMSYPPAKTILFPAAAADKLPLA